MIRPLPLCCFSNHNVVEINKYENRRQGADYHFEAIYFILYEVIDWMVNKRASV